MVRVFEDDPRKMRIPTNTGGMYETYASFGFEDLGDGREYSDDPPYRLVRLPEGWSHKRDPGHNNQFCIYDDRGILRAIPWDDHYLTNRMACTAIRNVGRDAAYVLFHDDAGSLDAIKFDLLTIYEIEDLVEELERVISENSGSTVAEYRDRARRAKHWLGILAERSRQEPKTLP